MTCAARHRPDRGREVRLHPEDDRPRHADARQHLADHLRGRRRGFRFVKMATDLTGAVSFRQGNGGSASAPGNPADPASNFNADGTIRIVVPGSAIGNPQPGQELKAFLTRIAIEVPNVGTAHSRQHARRPRARRELRGRELPAVSPAAPTTWRPLFDAVDASTRESMTKRTARRGLEGWPPAPCCSCRPRGPRRCRRKATRWRRGPTGVAELYIPNAHQPCSRLPAELASRRHPQSNALGVAGDQGFYDLRAGPLGRPGPGDPLVPGPGVGNTLTWAALGRSAPASDAAYKAAVGRPSGPTSARTARPRRRPAELGPPSIGSYENGRLVHINAHRVVDGVPVRNSFVKGTLEQRQPGPLRGPQLGHDRRLDHARAFAATRPGRWWRRTSPASPSPAGAGRSSSSSIGERRRQPGERGPRLPLPPGLGRRPEVRGASAAGKASWTPTAASCSPSTTRTSTWTTRR